MHIIRLIARADAIAQLAVGIVAKMPNLRTLLNTERMITVRVGDVGDVRGFLQASKTIKYSPLYTGDESTSVRSWIRTRFATKAVKAKVRQAVVVFGLQQFQTIGISEAIRILQIREGPGSFEERTIVGKPPRLIHKRKAVATR